MSLFIEVYVGSRDNRILVAESHAYNVSNLAKVSDYEYINTEYGAPALGIPPSEVKGNVIGHLRDQTVWALVEEIGKDARRRLLEKEIT